MQTFTEFLLVKAISNFLPKIDQENHLEALERSEVLIFAEEALLNESQMLGLIYIIRNATHFMMPDMAIQFMSGKWNTQMGNNKLNFIKMKKFQKSALRTGPNF